MPPLDPVVNTVTSMTAPAAAHSIRAGPDLVCTASPAASGTPMMSRPANEFGLANVPNSRQLGSPMRIAVCT